jgi:hypothetical protein
MKMEIIKTIKKKRRLPKKKEEKRMKAKKVPKYTWPTGAFDFFGISYSTKLCTGVGYIQVVYNEF